MSGIPDPDKVISIIRETAELDILPRFRRLEHHEVMEKNAGEVVTVADIEAEHRLTALLSELSPGSVVVGEEAVSRNPAVLDQLQNEGAAWLVDPVDGTANFAEGLRVFGVMVTYLVDGDARAGWIHDPCSGNTAIAVDGEGAWYDGKRMTPAAAVSLEQMIGTLNVGYFPNARHSEIRSAAKRFKEVFSYRCAAHDYLALAGGKKHFSLYRRLWPWDHAAGVLLLREAGGYSARLDGNPYRSTDRVQGLLSATDPDSWSRIRNFLTASDRH